MRVYIGVLLALFCITAAAPEAANALDTQDQTTVMVAPDVAIDAPVTLSIHAEQFRSVTVEPLPAHSARLEVIPRAGDPTLRVTVLPEMTSAVYDDTGATNDTDTDDAIDRRQAVSLSAPCESVPDDFRDPTLPTSRLIEMATVPDGSATQDTYRSGA